MAKYARRLAAALLATGLTGGAMVAATASASADEIKATCTANHACGYDYKHYGGRELFDTSAWHNKRIEFLNDRLESVSNRSDFKLCLYDWSGRQMSIPPHTGIRDIGEHKNYTDYIIAVNPQYACP